MSQNESFSPNKTEKSANKVKGLSQKQLCEHFGWDYKTIAREAKSSNLATHEYLIQKTGWILEKERYYPRVIPS